MGILYFIHLMLKYFCQNLNVNNGPKLRMLAVILGMRYPDTWISGYLDIQAILAIHYPDNKKVEISNYPSIQISVISKYPCIQVSGYIEN